MIIEYKQKIKELTEAQNGTSTINHKVPEIASVYKTFNDETLIELLAEPIEKPELSSREKKLFTLLQDGNAKELNQRLEYFRAEGTIECPYCFQPVSLEYRESLVSSIEKVLSDFVEEHQRKLQAYLLDLIEFDLNLYAVLDGYQECVTLVTKLNRAIQKNNENIQAKVGNPYNPIITECQDVQLLANQLADALCDLEKARLEYNSDVQKTGPIIDELHRINDEIAHYDVASLAVQYHKQKNEYDQAKSLLDSLGETYANKNKKLDDLEAQRRNVQLAIDEINAYLKYIFFAEDRLKIEYVNGEYKLLSHGKSVKPCDVSVGERNIIGLSYFFTSILEGKEEKDAYNQEYLLVIDDPISSYDVENKIGILSFLKYKIGLFLEGNMNTKALIMTHDLQTYYDMHKILEEILDVCKQKGYPNPPKFNQFELREKHLEQFAYKKRQEYTEIMEVVYSYAKGQADCYDIVIGNMMRQIMEAFSTFEYKKGIEEVSNDEKILALLREEKYISYFRNLMYRLVLHGGSHKEEQVKTLSDMSFFSLISDTEKQRTARDVLCFIYLLNSRHLLEHLKNCGDVESEIQSWCADIKSRSTVI